MNTAQELLNENIEASIVFEYKLLKENHFSWRNTYHGTLQVTKLFLQSYNSCTCSAEFSHCMDQ